MVMRPSTEYPQVAHPLPYRFGSTIQRSCCWCCHCCCQVLEDHWEDFHFGLPFFGNLLMYRALQDWPTSLRTATSCCTWPADCRSCWTSPLRGGDEPRTGRGRSREEPFSVSGDLHHLQQNLLNSLGFDILRRWEKYWPPRSCFFVLLASILSMSVYAGGMRHAQVTSLTCDCVTCVTIHCGMGRHPRPEGGQLGRGRCGGQHWGGVRGREHWNLGGEVKFSNVDLHLPGDHEVGQGKISVHDLVTVEILHPRDDLIKDVSGLRFREGMFGILDTLPV